MPQHPPHRSDMPRPARRMILDELGLPKTLPAGAGDFLHLHGAGPDTLLLGLGPHPSSLPELLGLSSAQGRIHFIEAPQVASQLGEAWRSGIPAHFEAVDAARLSALARSTRIVLYRPGPRLFPGFWGPLLARLQLSLLPQAPAPKKELVWLPGGEGDLLRLELREAFETLGFAVRELADEKELRGLLAGGQCPALYFSVNFRGLDPLGEAAHLLEAAGARVAVWCVDNPLHLLSGLKARFWTSLPLFVTDDWFKGPLEQLGAQSVRHLPLAARAADLAGPARPPSPAFADLSERLVFVGRSAFPGKAEFFAGCRLPDSAWTEARRLLANGGRPDFGWWLGRLGIDRLWPGAEVRKAGFCAEETGRAWRTDCLKRARIDLSGQLTVFGDEGWKELLPDGADLRGPVDYYTTLPDICASALACLNCTSPLLPGGLTQRHFDTFAWGGLLLTDATPGLTLFPAELTREISFRRPEDIIPRLKALQGSASGAQNLKTAWRAELCARHTYVHRVKSVLESLELG